MKRVLIVDDAIDLGRLFQDALKTAHPGMPITVVPSAEEALLESFRLTVDLLVTDIRLPGMSGIELVRKIRVRQPQVKVLMITGITLDSRMQKELDESRVDAFRRKPLVISEFLELADSLLGLSEPSPAAAAAPEPEDDLLAALAAALPGGGGSAQEKVAALKQTGALRMPAPPEPPSTGLSTCLSGLRANLGALAALLIDERGRVVAQAGDLPEKDLIANLVSPLAAALSAAARVSHLLGKPAAESVQAYRGLEIDLVAAPVGQFALLLALRPGRSSLRLPLAFEEAMQARPDLVQALENMGLLVLPPGEAAPAELQLADTTPLHSLPDAAGEPALDERFRQDPGLEKLEALFEKTTQGEMALPDADSFWETAASSEPAEGTPPGMLNYDQAQRLGLLPEEPE